MNCPPEIAAVLLDILYTGLLTIRAAGWNQDASRAASEADHLHNLPAILHSYSFDLLRYYWETERPAYLERVGPAAAAGYQEHWKKLAELAFEVTPVGQRS